MYHCVCGVFGAHDVTIPWPASSLSVVLVCASNDVIGSSVIVIDHGQKE